MGDVEVVAAIAAGDPAGLAEAYDRYAAPLYRFCRGMLPEPADAADVVQDTFVIAVPRMSALRDPQRLRPWLYTVARNECLRKLRSSSLQAPLEDAPEVTDEGADVEADVEKAELRALVRARSRRALTRRRRAPPVPPAMPPRRRPASWRRPVPVPARRPAAARRARTRA